MVALCEITPGVGLRCVATATGWCRACDRATCDEHRRVSFEGPARVERCQTCAALADEAGGATQRAYQRALADISESIRILRTRECAATGLATAHAMRTPLLRPWARNCTPIYSIRYWLVGTFAWLQSCAGGYGDHELMTLGVGNYPTVVNERGQITRLDEEEILTGRAALAQLLSAPTATVAIAATLRTYLT